MDENELIKGIKNKNEDCFINVVNLYKKKILSLCYSYTNDYYDAEDLSQEVFVSLNDSIHKFRGESSLSTYIYRITLSKCIDFKRKKSIKNLLSGLINLKTKEEDIDEKNYVRQSIIALSEDLKKVVILYYYIGLTQKEIGEILRISEKAVEGRIYRAKQKLKLEFEKEGYYLWKKKETI